MISTDCASPNVQMNGSAICRIVSCSFANTKHLVGKQEAYDKCKAERQYDLRILLPSSEICKRGKQYLS